MAKFKGIVALKKEDLDTLFQNGFVIVNGTRIDYDEGTVYVIEDDAVYMGLPLGIIVLSSVEIDEPCMQKADGRSLAQDGIYADFCTWLKNRITAGATNVSTCTIEEYANSMLAYGQCGKYVINDTAETITSGNYSVPANSIKLPTLVEFLASNNGGQEIGSAQLDMFKSHDHYVALSNNSVSDSDNSYSANWDYQKSITSGVYSSLSGGEETRPKNVRYPCYIVVATVTKTAAQINMNNVANEINLINSKLINTEKIEDLYDMEGGSALDWGKSGGIITSTNIPDTIDLSKYECLDLYCKSYSMQANGFLKIENANNISSTCISNARVESGVEYRVHFMITISEDKKQLTFTVYQNNVEKTGLTDFYISKIKGRLRQ